LQNPPNIVCTGQVRALPSLEGIQRLWPVRLLAFICHIPHLPVKPAVGQASKIPILPYQQRIFTRITMSNDTNESVKMIGTLASIATIIGVCIAIIALIPAFGQWLNPREPISSAAPPDIVIPTGAQTIIKTSQVTETITPENVSRINELGHWLDYWMDFAFTPDGETLASCNYDTLDKTVRLWDINTRQLLFILEGHNEQVASVAINPSGTLIASGSMDGMIALWDITSGKLLRTLNGNVDGLYSLEFSPDGHLLASGNLDNAGNLVQLWEPETGKLLFTFTGRQGYINSVAFSPDSQILASGGNDGAVRLWNVATGELIRELTNHTNEAQHVTYRNKPLFGGRPLGVTSVTFSPDGSILASGNQDANISLWDVTSGQLIQKISAGSWVNSVAFSPDGRILAVGTDNQVQLWNISTRQILLELDGHAEPVMRVDFSPNGRILISSSWDNTVRQWGIYP